MEKAEKILQIEKIMREENLQPSEIPTCNSAITTIQSNAKEAIAGLKNDIEHLTNIGKVLYSGLRQYASSEDAYSFACDNIDSQFLDYLDIKSPRKYKLVTVDISVDLMVPDCWEESFIEDYARQQDLSIATFDIHTAESEIEDLDVERYEYANSIDDFEECDFNE